MFFMFFQLKRAVGHEVDKFHQEKCCGCKVNHPSQRRHERLMIEEKKDG